MNWSSLYWHRGQTKGSTATAPSLRTSFLQAHSTTTKKSIRDAPTTTSRSILLEASSSLSGPALYSVAFSSDSSFRLENVSGPIFSLIMNLFLLSVSATKAVVALCDQHVVKMILETAQILYCAHHIMSPDALTSSVAVYNASRADGIRPYKATHKMHPISLWVRAHPYHYSWACEYALIMCKEYTLRFGKTHKTEQHLQFLRQLGYPSVGADYRPAAPKKQTKDWVHATTGIPEVFFYFPLCMPEEHYCRDPDGQYNAVRSYRSFYSNKDFAMRYAHSMEPEWRKSLRKE